MLGHAVKVAGDLQSTGDFVEARKMVLMK